MKRKGGVFGGFLMLIFLNACSLEALKENLLVTGESGYNYTESRKQWIRLRDQDANTYRYSVLETSVNDRGSETTITVENGKVTARDFEAFTISEEDGSRNVIFSYSENKQTLGSHQRGAPAVNIDELYDTCLGDYLGIDNETNTIYFDTHEGGIISLCGYVPDLCQDDCFVGFDISYFSWGIN